MGKCGLFLCPCDFLRVFSNHIIISLLIIPILFSLYVCLDHQSMPFWTTMNEPRINRNNETRILLPGGSSSSSTSRESASFVFGIFISIYVITPTNSLTTYPHRQHRQPPHLQQSQKHTQRHPHRQSSTCKHTHTNTRAERKTKDWRTQNIFDLCRSRSLV